MMEPAEEDTRPVHARWPELLLALFMMALALLVLADSLRVGIGWGDDGPRSGYFPFYIGLALLASSAWTALSQWRSWRDLHVFAARGQLLRVFAVLWPMAVYVVAISLLGIYVASALLIAWFMLRHGRHGALMTAAVALGAPLAFFMTFERWFLVPLPKGPLEALFGL